MANKEKEKSETEKLKNEVDASAKLFDVAGPGKTPALATSRPIIVKHGSMVQHDPMVVKDSEKSSKSELAKDVSTAHELKIEPDTTDAKEVEEPEKEAVLEENIDEESTSNSDDTVESTPSDSGAVDTLANEVDAKQADKKEKKELEERTIELEKSIESKEFFVPIGVASRRRSNRRILWVFILLIVFGAIGLNFAIDAGVIDIGVPALTDLL